VLLQVHTTLQQMSEAARVSRSETKLSKLPSSKQAAT
jgi:hypothetical protein